MKQRHLDRAVHAKTGVRAKGPCKPGDSERMFGNGLWIFYSAQNPARALHGFEARDVEQKRKQVFHVGLSIPRFARSRKPRSEAQAARWLYQAVADFFDAILYMDGRTDDHEVPRLFAQEFPPHGRLGRYLAFQRVGFKRAEHGIFIDFAARLF